MKIAKRDRQHNGQAKRQTMIYKTPHRKLKIEQHEPNLKPEMNSGAHEGLAVPALLVSSVVLLFTGANIRISSRRKPLNKNVEQELLTLREHLSSSSVKVNIPSCKK